MRVLLQVPQVEEVYRITASNRSAPLPDYVTRLASPTRNRHFDTLVNMETEVMGSKTSCLV